MGGRVWVVGMLACSAYLIPSAARDLLCRLRSPRRRSLASLGMRCSFTPQTPPTGAASPGRSTPRRTPSAAIRPATRRTSSACCLASTARSWSVPAGRTCAPTRVRPRCARRSPRSKRRRPMGPLQLVSTGLSAAAADHVTGPGSRSADLEHRGTDGSDPAGRAFQPLRPLDAGAMAENIAYGDNPAREVVIQLHGGRRRGRPGPPGQHPGPEMEVRGRRLRAAPASTARCA